MSNDINLVPVIELAKGLGKADALIPSVVKIDGIDCQVTAAGKITPLRLPDSFLESPRRKRGLAEFYEPASFIAYVNDHKHATATLITGTSNETTASFSAHLDYHERGAGKAGFGDHWASLDLRVTPEWKRWIGKNEQFMPQEEFAEFIDANLLDIVEPDAASILEVAQGLQGKKSVSFKSGRRLDNGSIQFELVEEITVNGTTSRRDDTFQVPSKFKLQLVPFIGANGIQIEARLRYRLVGGAVVFGYFLTRPYKVIEDVFLATRDDIENETDLKVHLGTAEIKPVA